jgi:hypothetical protein
MLAQMGDDDGRDAGSPERVMWRYRRRGVAEKFESRQ